MAEYFDKVLVKMTDELEGGPAFIYIYIDKMETEQTFRLNAISHQTTAVHMNSFQSKNTKRIY